MKREILLVSAIILIITISTALFFISVTPQPIKQHYTLSAEIDQAYFKVWNTSVASGIGYKQIISCILFVNVTNTSNIDMSITRVRVEELNDITGFSNDFSGLEDYVFPPNTSRLLSFSNVGGLFCLSYVLEAFERSPRLLIKTSLEFEATEGNSIGGAGTYEPMDLRQVGEGEYVWGNLTANSNLLFGINKHPIDVGQTGGGQVS